MVQIDDNTVQRTALRVGSVLVAQQERRAERAWRRAEPPKMELDEPPERLYIAVIGSGSVESACKRIISARLKQAGMIWTRDGAQAMAQLQATIRSNRWDPFWASHNRTRRTYRRAA